MTHGERDQPFGCLQRGGFLLGTSDSAVLLDEKNEVLLSLGGGECPCFILIFLQIFANQGRKGQRNGDREKEGELWGEMHTKIEREDGRPVFSGHPSLCIFAVVSDLLICSFLSSFTMTLDRYVYC